MSSAAPPSSTGVAQTRHRGDVGVPARKNSTRFNSDPVREALYDPRQSESSPFPHNQHTTQASPRASPNMTDKSQRRRGHKDDGLLSLNEAINALVLAKNTASTIPTKNAFTSITVLLTTIRVSLVPDGFG